MQTTARAEGQRSALEQRTCEYARCGRAADAIIEIRGHANGYARYLASLCAKHLKPTDTVIAARKEGA